MRPLGKSGRTILNDAETLVANDDCGASKSLAADFGRLAVCM
jgi:hypothetical protein